jgi:hypothetical protein
LKMICSGRFRQKSDIVWQRVEGYSRRCGEELSGERNRTRAPKFGADIEWLVVCRSGTKPLLPSGLCSRNALQCANRRAVDSAVPIPLRCGSGEIYLKKAKKKKPSAGVISGGDENGALSVPVPDLMTLVISRPKRNPVRTRMPPATTEEKARVSPRDGCPWPETTGV